MKCSRCSRSVRARDEDRPGVTAILYSRASGICTACYQRSLRDRTRKAKASETRFHALRADLPTAREAALTVCAHVPDVEDAHRVMEQLGVLDTLRAES